MIKLILCSLLFMCVWIFISCSPLTTKIASTVMDNTSTSTSPQTSGQISFDPVPKPIDENTSQALLLAAGYGYEYGDIILLATKTEPEVGDVVLFNSTLNKSNFHAFGPGYLLVKIIALPDEYVTFEGSSYKANGYVVNVRITETKNVIWGTTIYPDVSGLTLHLPDNEYLGDRWIGPEGLQEYMGKSDNYGYNRFTIKGEAISGVVVKKIGHQDTPQITY